MRVARVETSGRIGLAVKTGEGVRLVAGSDGDLDALVASGGLDALKGSGDVVDEASLTFLPPLVRPSKIICLGLNYKDHAAEGGFSPPEFPVIFGRFASGLVGHNQPILVPELSSQLDFEGELVAVISRRARKVAKDSALDHVAGYSVFNDGSVRDYQMKTPQWTAGKNFDDTGGFGPWFVTPDELPPGASGLAIETKLNGEVVQKATTADMIFDVATTIALLSSFMTLEPGDVLVTGTPAGVGVARKPQLFMKDGDVCEVEIEGVGLLRNPIANA